MERFKVFLCLCLCTVLLCAAAIAEGDGGVGIDATPIELNVPVTAVIDEPGGCAYFSFTPEETGEYVFFSISDVDTYGYIYDADMNEIDSDDDSGDGSNFRIAHELVAGEQYYFGALYYSSNNTGSFEVVCSAQEDDGDDGFNPTPIELGVPAMAVITQRGGYAYFSFTPAVTGGYEFYSSANNDTYGYLYDADMNQIDSDDDNGDDNNFRIVHELVAGEQYYFGARYYSSSNTGSFEVVLKRENNNHLVANAVNGTVWTEIGGSATLAVRASCDEGEIYYRWFDSEGDIEGAEGSSYTVENVTQAQSYSCEVTDDFGNEVVVMMQVQIENNLRISPVGSDEFTVMPGETVQLGVVASCAVGGLSYQWYDNEGAAIDGATGTTLTVEDIQSYGEYMCRVRDDYDGTAEQWFYIDIDNELTAKRVGPEDVSFLPDDESVTLAVRASCAIGELTYEWYSERDGEWIEGADGPTYVVKSCSGYDEYECLVSDEYDNHVSVFFYVFLDNGFQIVDEWQNILVPYGESAALHVTAYCDNGPLTYQWYHGDYYDDYELYDEDMIEGADTPDYITPPITAEERFSCLVTDMYGTTRIAVFSAGIDNHFSVTAVGSTEIVRRPLEPVTLAVNAQCDSGELEYRWYVDYFDIATGNWEYESVPGGATFALQDYHAYGYFECEVRDQFGNYAYVGFDVDLDSDFWAEADGEQVIRLAAGQSATLKVNAGASEGAITYQWYRYDTPISGATGDTYTTPALTADATYTCRVKNTYAGTIEVAFSCMLSEIDSLVLDQSVRVSVDEGEVRVFAFTPDATDTYTLESSGNQDPYAHLYDDRFIELAHNDDGGPRNNFKLTQTLTAGRQYYYGVHMYDYESGSFTMRLVRGNGTIEINGELFLRVGQTVEIAPYDNGDELINVHDVDSDNPAVLEPSGARVTAKAAGTAILAVNEGDYSARYYRVTVGSASVIELPGGLQQLQAGAFAGDDSVACVEVPAGVSRVEKDAFNGSGLKQIVVNGRDTILAAGALRGTSDALIMCPKDSRAANFARQYGFNYVYID